MILDDIVKDTKIRVEEAKTQVSPGTMKMMAEQLEEASKSNKGQQFKEALMAPDISFICEVKKASPSKGLIAEDFDYKEIAKAYENAGAAAISVLTEPKYFLGSNDYLREIAAIVKTPILRKDFVVDAYQIYEARVIGASAILLISEITTSETLKEYIELAHSLGLAALVEAHTEEELQKAVGAGAEIVGVNNRNLKNFHVDFSTTRRLRNLVPKDIIFIAESGVKDAEDIQTLREIGIDGVLIGETLMKSPDKKKKLDELRGH